jgi:hypothetical protein
VVDPEAPNPFSPTFGSPPAVIVGRQQLLDDIRRAFGADTHPARKTLLRAHRGSGKTVLLNAIQDLAAERGWLIVQEDAASRSRPLLDRLCDQLRGYLAEIDPKPKKRVTSAQASVLGIGAAASWQATTAEARSTTLRGTLTELLERRTEPVNGVLLSIDEIHEATRDEIHELANAVQHLDRARLPIALALAGLPTTADDKEPTFLARCHTPALTVVADDEIERGLRETIAIAGWEFAPRALNAAVHVAAGYPYMMQIIGWESFELARDHLGRVEVGHVHAATPGAQRRLSRSELFTIDQRISGAEREFLVAMAHDDVESRMKDIAIRMRQSAQYANVYRQRLLEAGLIKQLRRGYVDFVIPGHRCEIRAEPAYAASRASLQRELAIEAGADPDDESRSEQ